MILYVKQHHIIISHLHGTSVMVYGEPFETERVISHATSEFLKNTKPE